MLGREGERSAIDAVIEAVRGGRSGSLVVQGDAGMGKTTLLEYAAVASTPDLQVARIAGIEAETEFGFAALQRLFIPYMDGFDRLPARQRDALGSAFGLAVGPPADRFLVGLAALTLMAEVAREQPLLCLVDDAQWLDRESLDALAFLGRRLYADRIALLFAVRTSAGTHVPLEGLPVLQVDGLPDATVLELLESVADRPVAPDVARRIVAETQGCPLAVTELAGELTSEQLAGARVLPDPMPISGRLERHYLAQIRRLPPETQLVMLIAAAEPTGDATTLWRAALRLGVTPAAADPAEATALVALRWRVEFRHPLVRSAVYGGASAADRRRVHAALAAVTSPDVDPDGRAWHLAAASLGPDEAVASELEQGALRARRRGRYAADAALLSRSAELTPDAGERARRLLNAAQLHQVAGAPLVARALLDEATPLLQEPLLRAQATRLRASLSSYTIPAKIPAVLVQAAQVLEALDVRLARQTHAEALEAVMVSGHLTRGTSTEAVARAALDAPPSPDPQPTIADLMIDGWGTRLAVGYREAVPHLRRIVHDLCADDTPYAGFARWSALGANAGTELWDAEGYRTTLLRLEQNERDRGALDSLRITLGGLGHGEMWTGRFAASEARHTEATDIAVALGAPEFVWETLKVELFAWQGKDAETRSIAKILTTDLALEAGAGVAVNLALVALTILELGQGAYAAALESSWQLFESDVPPQGTQILPALVEAAVRSGDRARAEAALVRLRERASATATPWALGLLARTEALMAAGEDAEAQYRLAIAALGETIVRTDLAHAHLLYGEWLRRQNRRLDAREQLQTAHDLFSAMGAMAFADRARVELAATGARARKRTVETSNALTPQEAQIAGLAATGVTRSEIAGQLYLSASTIDYHLRKVYRKLGVSSRSQLRKALPESVR